MMNLTRTSSPTATAAARGARQFVPVDRLNGPATPIYRDGPAPRLLDVELESLEPIIDIESYAHRLLTRISTNSADVTDVALIVTHDDASAVLALARNGHLGLVDVPIDLPWWADEPVVICYDAIARTYSVFTASATHRELHDAFARSWPS